MTKEELKQYIDDNIYENVDGDISGDSLNEVMKAIVDDGGTEVVANPSGDATTPLNKIKIGETNYNIPQTDTSNLATKTELQQGLSGKQDTILDLEQIRTRADEGHTALQPVQNATPNNFASFDSNGGIQDSTYKAADFATAAQGTKADNAIPMPTGTDGQILEKDSNETSGVKWVQKPQDGKSALQIYNETYGTNLDEAQFIDVLKQNYPMEYVAYDQTAAGQPIGTGFSAIDTLNADSTTAGKMYLMPNDGTTPNGTILFVTVQTPNSNPATYQWYSLGALSVPSNVLTENDVVNDLTTGGVEKPLSAEQGLVVGKHESAYNAFIEGQELHEPINWLDLNSTDIEPNKYINPSNGSLLTNSDYETSGYIPVKDGQTYKLAYFNKAGTAIAYQPLFHFGINEYDINKTRIRTIDKGNGSHTYQPSNDAKYFRFCSLKGRMIDGRTMLYFGEEPTLYSNYFQPYSTFLLKDDIVTEDSLQDNSVGSSKIKDNSIGVGKLQFTETIHGKNLFDGTLYPNFLDNQGDVALGGYYSHSDKISVIPGESYHISLGGDKALTTASTVVCMCFYNNGVFDSYLPSQTKQFTVPSTANQFAFSVENERLTQYGDLQLEQGTSRTDYEAYFEKVVIDEDVLPPLKENSVDTKNIKDGAITQEKLSDNITVASKPNKFDGWKASGEVVVGENIKIDKYFRCRKGFVATALIIGTIQSVRFHVMDWYLDIDQTNLSVSPVTGSTMLVYPHGLQLGAITTILVDMGNGNNPGAETTIKIVDADGNVFTKTSVDFRWANGYVKLDNNNTNGSITVSLAAYNKNLNKKIWLFGDSYLSYGDPEKWITKMFGWGYNNLFLDQQGGENATQSFADLSIMLESGAKPSYIVWCLGMNAGTDSNNQVNTTWLGVTQQLIELCESIGCELVLATIPSTPSLSHVKLNEWVRNSGYRYIDFAAAVEDGIGTYPNYWRLWGNDTSTPAAGALLKSDKVHPTQYGAVELAARVLIDFPEITVID